MEWALLQLIGRDHASIQLQEVCVRERFAPANVHSAQHIAWTPTVILVPAATLITAAAIGACWSYVGPMAAELGLSPHQIGIAVTDSLIFQILGSFVVAIVGWRLSFRIALIGGAIIQAFTAMVLLGADGPMEFIIALGIFGFLWQGGMPFAMDLI